MLSRLFYPPKVGWSVFCAASYNHDCSGSELLVKKGSYVALGKIKDSIPVLVKMLETRGPVLLGLVLGIFRSQFDRKN